MFRLTPKFDVLVLRTDQGRVTCYILSIVSNKWLVISNDIEIFGNTTYTKTKGLISNCIFGKCQSTAWYWERSTLDILIPRYLFVLALIFLAHSIMVKGVLLFKKASRIPKNFMMCGSFDVIAGFLVILAAAIFTLIYEIAVDHSASYGYGYYMTWFSGSTFGASGTLTIKHGSFITAVASSKRKNDVERGK